MAQDGSGSALTELKPDVSNEAPATAHTALAEIKPLASSGVTGTNATSEKNTTAGTVVDGDSGSADQAETYDAMEEFWKEHAERQQAERKRLGLNSTAKIPRKRISATPVPNYRDDARNKAAKLAAAKAAAEKGWFRSVVDWVTGTNATSEKNTTAGTATTPPHADEEPEAPLHVQKVAPAALAQTSAAAEENKVAPAASAHNSAFIEEGEVANSAAVEEDKATSQASKTNSRHMEFSAILAAPEALLLLEDKADTEAEDKAVTSSLTLRSANVAKHGTDEATMPMDANATDDARLHGEGDEPQAQHTALPFHAVPAKGAAPTANAEAAPPTCEGHRVFSEQACPKLFSRFRPMYWYSSAEHHHYQCPETEEDGKGKAKCKVVGEDREVMERRRQELRQLSLQRPLFKGTCGGQDAQIEEFKTSSTEACMTACRQNEGCTFFGYPWPYTPGTCRLYKHCREPHGIIEFQNLQERLWFPESPVVFEEPTAKAVDQPNTARYVDDQDILLSEQSTRFNVLMSELQSKAMTWQQQWAKFRQAQRDH